MMDNHEKIDIYGGDDPRDIPICSIGDAARYLRIPAATISSWTVGRNYQTLKEGLRFFKPLITIKDLKPRLLSFTNLVEIHVLRAIRKDHKIQLDKVRIALDYIDEEFNLSHPLAHQRFRTDGVDLFIERYNSLVNTSKREKIELKQAFNQHLQRIEPDDTGLAIKLYPFTRSHEENNPKIVVIDPKISFGRLIISGTGIPTRVLAERYRAGESIEELAYDYDCQRLYIEEAIRCELPIAA